MTRSRTQRTLAKRVPRTPPLRKRADAARAEIKRILGAECFVCRVKPRSGWVAHHLAYAADGAHYARSPSYHVGGHRLTSDRYALALLEEVREHPDRFVALCRRHHYAVERMLATDPDKLGRTIEVVMRSL